MARRGLLLLLLPLAAWLTATLSASRGLTLSHRPSPPQLLTRPAFLQLAPRGSLAVFTLANAAYADMALNWALVIRPILHSRDALDHFFVAALDDELATLLLSRSVPTMRVGLGGSSPQENASEVGGENFRLKFSKFRAYGATKAQLIEWLLREHRDVVVSDVDTAWLQSPHQLLHAFPEADLMAGTDCLHLREDDDRSHRGSAVARCGHHAGAHWSAWFNTGVLLFRSTPAAISFASEWQQLMASVHGDGVFGSQVGPSPRVAGFCRLGPGDVRRSNLHLTQTVSLEQSTILWPQVDDQLTFNQLLEARNSSTKKIGLYPIRAAREDGRIIFDGTGTRRVAPLPARWVCSGHVFHIQQAVERRDCVVMHLTFVEAERAGKRWRLREAGLFPVQAEAIEGGRFITYTPPQPGDTPPERHPALVRPTGKLDPIPNMTSWPGDSEQGWSVATALWASPRLIAHLELVDRHLLALRNALALARVLNRELILPRLHCMCERSQSPRDILPACVKNGATTDIPFLCPAEQFLNIEEFEGLWTSGYVVASPLATHSTIELPWAMTDHEMRRALNQSSNSTLLHFESLEGPVFGGFVDEAEGREFQEAVQSYVAPGKSGYSGTWCCTHGHYQAGTIKYKTPVPLPSGAMLREGEIGRKLREAALIRAAPDKQPRQCYWQDCLPSNRKPLGIA
ncbi:MAG: hypothetical protein SGPRY_008129 [Prymnesium sp.]